LKVAAGKGVLVWARKSSGLKDIEDEDEFEFEDDVR
jgi:hypothetical protein